MFAEPPPLPQSDGKISGWVGTPDPGKFAAGTNALTPSEVEEEVGKGNIVMLDDWVKEISNLDLWEKRALYESMLKDWMQHRCGSQLVVQHLATCIARVATEPTCLPLQMSYLGAGSLYKQRRGQRCRSGTCIAMCTTTPSSRRWWKAGGRAMQWLVGKPGSSWVLLIDWHWHRCILHALCHGACCPNCGRQC